MASAVLKAVAEFKGVAAMHERLRAVSSDPFTMLFSLRGFRGAKGRVAWSKFSRRCVYVLKKCNTAFTP